MQGLVQTRYPSGQIQQTAAGRRPRCFPSPACDCCTLPQPGSACLGSQGLRFPSRSQGPKTISIRRSSALRFPAVIVLVSRPFHARSLACQLTGSATAARSVRTTLTPAMNCSRLCSHSRCRVNDRAEMAMATPSTLTSQCHQPVRRPATIDWLGITDARSQHRHGLCARRSVGECGVAATQLSVVRTQQPPRKPNRVVWGGRLGQREPAAGPSHHRSSRCRHQHEAYLRQGFLCRCRAARPEARSSRGRMLVHLAQPRPTKE